MAESGDGGWWDWIQTAKDQVVSQSAEVFEFVRKDIDEFTKVVSEEASSMVSSTANSLKEKLKLDEEESTVNTMKKSVSGFLSHVAEVFTPPPEDDDEEAFVIQNQQPIFLNRLQAATYAVQQDPATFLTDPEGEEKLYEEWLKSFDLKTRQNDLTQLLVDCENLRHNYTKLVPVEVSHVVFWHRYFYKLEILEKVEAKRQEIKKRAQETSVEGTMAWDEEDAFGGNADISEQMQKKLLEDYEKECLSTNQIKNKVNASPDNKQSDPSKSCDKETVQTSEEKISKDYNGGHLTTPSVPHLSSASTLSEVESNEEEWEKVNANDSDLCSSRESPSKASSTGKSDDWENWE